MRNADAVAVLKATVRAITNADITLDFIDGVQYLERLPLLVDDDPFLGVPYDSQQRRSEFQKASSVYLHNTFVF